MKAVSLLQCFLDVWILIGVAWAQQCTPGFPVFDESRTYSAFTGTRGGRQLLFPSQQFSCSGIVTRISAQVIGSSTSGIDFQIWRPRDNGTYELVWGMEFNVLLRGSRDGNNISIEPLIQEIPVRPRDVIGLFLRNEEPIGVQYENETDTIGTVFYVEGINGPLCNFSLCDPDVHNTTNASPLIDVVFEAMLDPNEMELSLAGTHDRCTTTGFSSCSMQPTGVIPMPVPTAPPDPPDGRNSDTTMPPILTTPPPQPQLPTSPPPGNSEDQILTTPPPQPPETGTNIVVPATIGSSLLIGIAVVTLIFFARYKKQKSFAVSEQQQTAVPEHEEQFEMAKNDAYTAVIATERSEAYMMNTNSIPVARNEAYGVTQLEGGNTLNREDTTGDGYVVSQLVNDELSEQHTQQEDNTEHSYEYVYSNRS